MRRIYTLGETILDLLFKGNALQQVVPGGAMLNTAVSLGRLSLPVYLISEWGKDVAGAFIRNFLVDNKVDTHFVYEYDNGKTALALASLDAMGNANYTFYKEYPLQRLQVDPPTFHAGDFLLIGSFFALDPLVRQPLVEILRRARQQGAFLVYDPNFRKNHLDQLPQMIPFVEENFKFAHLVRGSHEDFMFLFQTADPYEIYQHSLDLGCDHLIITRGGEEMLFMKPRMQTSLQPHPADIVSTVGAGDTFNAGLVFAMYRKGIFNDNYRELLSCEWGDMLEVASTFAAHACASYENYISESFAKQILNSLYL